MVNQLVRNWDGLESLVCFVGKEMGMIFKMKMEGIERGWKRFEMISKIGKGVWRG